MFVQDEIWGIEVLSKTADTNKLLCSTFYSVDRLAHRGSRFLHAHCSRLRRASRSTPRDWAVRLWQCGTVISSSRTIIITILLFFLFFIVSLLCGRAKSTDGAWHAFIATYHQETMWIVSLYLHFVSFVAATGDCRSVAWSVFVHNESFFA